MTQAPIHNLDAELALLGGVLDDPDFIDQIVADGLSAEDLYKPLHRRAWQALVELRTTDTAIDEVTLWTHLEATGPTRPEWYREILGWSSHPAAQPTHAAHHARVIAKYSRLRALHRESAQIADACTHPGADPSELAARLSEELDKAGPRRDTQQDLKAILSGVLDQVNARIEREAPEGIATGFDALDEMIGALEATRLYVLAARPGMGKTALTLQLCLTAALRGPVYVASLEMSSAGLAERALALESRLDASLLREAWRMEIFQQNIMVQAAARLSKLPLVIDDASNVTPAELSARVRAFSRKHGAPALVAVDYLQRLSAPDTGTANRSERVGAGSWACKAIAKDHGCPVLLLSQLNRGCEQRSDKRPVLSDLKESGDIEQDADVVLGLYREGYYDNEARQDEAEIIVMKNRHGRSGQAHVGWIGHQTRFACKGAR